MHSIDWPCAVEAALVVPLLTIAAWTDIATRTIPDSIAAAIAVLGIAVRLFAGPSDSPPRARWPSHRFSWPI